MTSPTFQDLVRELTPRLSSYLERMVEDPAMAEDLLQESLIKISKGLATFEGRSSLKTWAYTIATRVAKDHFRRPAQRRNMVEFDEVHEVWDPRTDISEAFIAEEMNACIHEVIDSLPEDYRAALVLHELEGLTAQETADVCGTSLATAKIRIHRGRKRLEKALERACTFDTDDETLRCERKNPDRDSSWAVYPNLPEPPLGWRR